MIFFSIFQYSGRPPSWMCLPCFWTTYEAYLLVFTDVKFGCNSYSSFDNMKLCNFGDVNKHFQAKCAKYSVFWGFDLHGAVYQENPQKAHPCMERLTDCKNRSTSAICARAYETKKGKERNHMVQCKTGYSQNWVFARSTHVV